MFHSVENGFERHQFLIDLFAPDADKLQTSIISDNTDTTILPATEKLPQVSNKGVFVISDGDALIIDDNGQVIDVIKNGEYKVYDVRYDENGNPTIVRISPDGEEERWIVINQNGTDVGTFVAENQVGVYEFSDANLNIYDANGNLIGSVSEGKYRVYDIRYDANGQISEVKITAPGQEELWMRVCEDGKCIGNYLNNPTYVEETIVLDNNNSSIKLFNKKNLGIGAAIGVLALGAYGIAKKVKNNKDNQSNDADYDEFEDASPGEYNIYDIKKDDDGNIKEAFVKSNDDKNQNNDGYWLEF